MSRDILLMWVVRDHGTEGKAVPGRVVAVTESEDLALTIAAKEWSPSVRKALMLLDRDSGLARFVSEPYRVDTRQEGAP